ncbi:hypothetical protein O181_070479 [Austropuccinia psidii MF-1]|uniref:Uncharacterized protein n=1 Tax=Austropuccinia psidii MF-1 TaxID=1389203 RepID=A0A9Q3F1B8_9BASI|nr:hypothetical protein [Austropuccinia psidii MF-1]
MPIQHSPLARQTRSQARAQAFLTPTPRAPLDGTSAVPQLRAQLDRGHRMEGRKRAKEIKSILRSLVASQGTERPTLAQSDQPASHQSELSLLVIMQKMTQMMANLQEASSSESSIPPAFMTPFMKAPECFDGTQPFKFRCFIQSFK